MARDPANGMPEAAIQPLFRMDGPIEEDPIRKILSRSAPWMIHGEVFSQQSFGTGPWPDQGWKLHISATPLSAAEILEAVLGVLFAEGVRFKVVGSLALLAQLNFGELGPSQIGKFITVYPSDDPQAVRLATALHEATVGGRGPRVPTDRPLRPGSLVHYRYGAIIERAEAEEGGGTYGILDPAGRLADDARLQYYQPPPAEITDPFEAAGVYVPGPHRGRLLNGRYLVNNALAQPPRGGVFRAVDLGAEPVRLCLLKEAWHDVSLDRWGRDARDWAANEERILSRHAGDPTLPECYESFDVDGDCYLAIEYVEGTSLDRVLEEKHSLTDGIPPEDLVAIGLATAEALSHLHEIGLVFRDFKPANVIKTPAGGYRLIDFGLAYTYRDDDHPALGLGTPPFYSYEQYRGERPSPSDDIFAWGAVLHSLACGEPAAAEGTEQRKPFARRPVNEHRPDFPPALAQVIDRAVAWERAERYPTMREAREALAGAARMPHPQAAIRRTTRPQAPAPGREQDLSGLDAAEALLLAREVGDALCAAAEQRGGGLAWATRAELSDRRSYSPDLYAGASGIALYLAELFRATGEQRYSDAARGAACWLAGPMWGRGRAQHGLHAGEGGVAYFFLRLAQLLGEPGYVRAAELRLRRLRGAASGTMDLLYGTAGTIVALLHLHTATGAYEYLADARAEGDRLLAESAPVPGNRPGRYWRVASAFAGGPAHPYLGLLHGAAGIGLAFTRLGVATGDERYLDAARSAAEMLLGQAIAGEDGGLTWPRQLGDKVAGLQAHCHGAGGVGQFFLQLDRITHDARYREAAAGAARTIAAQRTSDSRSGICHGLSGTGHILLDSYQALGETEFLRAARESGRLLQRFRRPLEPNQTTAEDALIEGCTGNYAMNREGAVSADLMLGYAGVGSLFLRLAGAETAPDLILG